MITNHDTRTCWKCKAVMYPFCIDQLNLNRTGFICSNPDCDQWVYARKYKKSAPGHIYKMIRKASA